MRKFFPLFTAIAFLPFASFAALESHDHADHAVAKTSCVTKDGKPCSPSILGYQKANRTMHKNMDIKYTGNPDVDFARGMIPHHQGAVDMAKVELRYGKDPEVRKLAERILKTQKLEIDQMKHWEYSFGHGAWKDPKNSSIVANKAAIEKMHHDMNIRYTGNADVDFARGMVPHHQGAMDMADVQIKHGKDPMLREMSRNILSSQAQEIKWMQEWLQSKNKK